MGENLIEDGKEDHIHILEKFKDIADICEDKNLINNGIRRTILYCNSALYKNDVDALRLFCDFVDNKLLNVPESERDIEETVLYLIQCIILKKLDNIN